MMSWQAWAPPVGWPTAAPPVRWQTLSLWGPHQATLWLFELDAPSADTPSFTACLSDAEHTRAQRFRLPLHARRHRVAWSMVRHLLSHLSLRSASDLDWRLGAHGKPALAVPSARLHFNLSHSAGFALLATSATLEVGVDLEDTGSAAQMADMAPRILSPSEQAHFARANTLTPEHLLSTWVRKEACLKALGTGLNREMDCITLGEGQVRGATPNGSQGEELGDIRWCDVALPEYCHAQAALAWLQN